MRNIQASDTQFPNYIFLILYLITGSLSNFGAIDILAPQWIYLGCINILVCSYFCFSDQMNLTDPWVSSSLRFIFIYIFFILYGMDYHTYAVNQ